MMNELLTRHLLQRFPKMFELEDGPKVWGFECGDGWFDLIYRLCKDLEKLDPNIQLTQVKEKFGGLRAYLSCIPNARILARICQAEEESMVTCEECGKPGRRGNIKESSWIITRCPEHGVPA